MKIQCDVCEKAAATVICCADEAALCAKCDLEIHAANKLASKHQRLLLDSLSNKLPRCDICQEKAAFIFCVEDRALFCRDCDESIHIPGTLSGQHQRLLATGIRVALNCGQTDALTGKSLTDPPVNAVPGKSHSDFAPSAWAVDEFLQLSDYESGDKKESPEGFGDLDWFADMGLFSDHAPRKVTSSAAAEVPELPSKSINAVGYRSAKTTPLKKQRIEVFDADDYFTVPDLG